VDEDKFFRELDMNFLSRFALDSFYRLEARRWLYHLKDRRAFSPFLKQSVVNSSRLWPKVIPIKPRSIVDIGAHTGEIAAQFADLYHPDFFAFVEPLPQMRPSLESLRLAPRQKFFFCALGRTHGRAGLNVLANAPSSSLLEPAEDLGEKYHVTMDKVQVVDVEVRTLDDVFDECNLQELDLLKIDVEGYEIEVFEGGQKALQHTRVIVSEVVFFEAHKGRPLFGDVYAYLRKNGFELRDLVGYVYDDHGLPLHCDAVFLNRKLAAAESR
jgi:FkbM family methyltransferase